MAHRIRSQQTCKSNSDPCLDHGDESQSQGEHAAPHPDMSGRPKSADQPPPQAPAPLRVLRREKRIRGCCEPHRPGNAADQKAFNEKPMK